MDYLRHEFQQFEERFFHYIRTPNNGYDVRSGTVTVAGASITVTQGGLPHMYTLTLQTSGDGTGSFLVNGTKVNGATSLTYTSGTILTLQEVAGNQCTFMGWTGACSGAGSICTLTITQDMTVMAKFAKNKK